MLFNSLNKSRYNQVFLIKSDAFSPTIIYCQKKKVYLFLRLFKITVGYNYRWCISIATWQRRHN